MSNQKSFQQLHNLSGELKSLNLSLSTKLSLYGYQANSIISLCKHNTTESLSLASILFMDYCETSSQIKTLLKRQLELESQIGHMVHTCWKSQIEHWECGKSYQHLDTDGLTTNLNCPEENFEQLGDGLFPGMP